MVSGTIFHEKMNAKQETHAHTQKATEMLPKRFSKYATAGGNACPEMKNENHTANDATAMARPRRRVGKISDMISQLTGARPDA